jgi:hypothetical protein
MLWRSALCADSAAMLGAGSRRATRSVRCAQTSAAGQITKRAARADPAPALLVAPQIAPGGCRLPRRLRSGVRPEDLRGEVARRYAISVEVASRKPKAESRSQAATPSMPLCAQRRHGLRREPMPCPQRCAVGSPQRALRGAEERRTRGRARSALRDLTRRGCSSAVSAANVASSATGHVAEYRRAVGAQRRPPR